MTTAPAQQDAARRRYLVPALPVGIPPTPRPSLADQQAALVAALTGKGPVPPGFDRSRIRAAADALAHKRARAVAQVWPGLRTLLGDAFRARFDAYAAQAPLPELGGPLADGRAFVRALGTHAALTDDLMLQSLAVDQRWRQTARGLEPRRYPRFGVVRLRSVPRLIVAIGARELRFPLPVRRH